MSLIEILDDRVTAAVVAAAGTIIGALIQLRVAWRREVSERARGVPLNKKSRRGPVLAIFLLVFAAGVGGFALSQYFVGQTVRDSAALQTQLQAQMAQIGAAAARLEQASLAGRPAAAPVRDKPAVDAGADAMASASIGPCRVHAAAGNTAACSEQDALAVTLCAGVPAEAALKATTLFARVEDSGRPWGESQATPGQDLGHARFAEKTFERTDGERVREVCASFTTWDGDHAYALRLLAHTAPAAVQGAATLAAPAAGAERFARSGAADDPR